MLKPWLFIWRPNSSASTARSWPMVSVSGSNSLVSSNPSRRGSTTALSMETGTLYLSASMAVLRLNHGEAVHCGRLRALLALFHVEGHFRPVFQVLEGQPLQGILVEIYFPASFFEDKSVSSLAEQFAYDSAMRWGRRSADFFGRPLVPELAEVDGDCLERLADGFFERFILLAGGEGMAARQRHHHERFRYVR